MTREEKALIYFKDLRARKFKDYSSVFNTAPKDSVVYEAVSAEIEIYDTTIKALEQIELNTSYNGVKTELEPCDDCISRQAVMKCFKKWQPYMATRLWDYEQELKDLPSVTPKPNTGHWIKMGEGFTPYECSECEGVEFKKSKYCPNCGAEMEIENEKETC